MKTNHLTLNIIFMMGMNPDVMGVYSEEDVQFSSSFFIKRTTQKADLREAFMRINQMGVTGCVKQEIRKTLTNYNDGTFCWGRNLLCNRFDEKNCQAIIYYVAYIIREIMQILEDIIRFGLISNKCYG